MGDGSSRSKPYTLTEDELRERVDTYRRLGGNITHAAEASGINRSTMQYTLKIARERGMDIEPKSEISLPDFPAEDLSIEEIKEHRRKRYRVRKTSFDAHTWFSVNVKGKKPIGVLWFGDPHVDDDACDLDLLEQHIAICRQPGVYAVNIGDTTNNWVGRLVRLYANQDASVSTARKLAKDFLLDSGIRWLLIIFGNHDNWGDGAAILTQMAQQHGTQKLLCHDWEARFQLVFGNGWAPRVFAAHDFPGNSQWNPLHGPMKEGQIGQAADLYVCGHKHNWAAFTYENPARGVVQTFLRVRGYKDGAMDEYARHLGKHAQKGGASILTVFDPRDRSILYFENVEKGADYLAKLRAEA